MCPQLVVLLRQNSRHLIQISQSWSPGTAKLPKVRPLVSEIGSGVAGSSTSRYECFNHASLRHARIRVGHLMTKSADDRNECCNHAFAIERASLRHWQGRSHNLVLKSRSRVPPKRLNTRPPYPLPYASSRRCSSKAALINAKCVKACGKLPRCSPDGLNSSANNPRWLA